MARKSKERKLAEIHDEACKRFDVVIGACEDEREQCLQDRRFVHIPGAMWEGGLGEQFENRPQLESNEALISVIRIFNEYRNNRITADFVGRTGDESEELAELCDGLWRADEIDSASEEAYDNCFDEGTAGGMGAFRLTTQYEDEYDEDNDYQRIRFEPIYDADSCVFFDLNAKKYDKSDARFCYVLTGITREAYVEEYNDDPDEWRRSDLSHYQFDWSDSGLVYVAEYYLVEDVKENIHKYRTIGGDILKFNEDQLTDEKKAELNEVGTIPISVRQVKRRKVHKYILSGGGILEDCGHIAGEHIPIVPYYGRRLYIDGIERISGHVRTAKDMMRLRNMQISVLAERAAQNNDRTPIFTPEQIAGHEVQWSEKAVKKPAFLMLNPIQQMDGSEIAAGPIGFDEPAAISQAEAALLDLSKQEIADLLGRQGAGEEMVANTSGYAVELIQSRLDGQSFLYLSNFAKSIKRAAQIWLSMARVVYNDEERKMKVVDEQDQSDFVEVGRKVLADGKPELEADLSKARFDVAVDVGPASRTKQQAMIKSLIEMLGVIADPADQKVISATIMRNLQGEGLGSIREHFRRQLVQMGVEEPTEAEMEDAAAEQEQQQPDAQNVYLISEAQKNNAQAQKAQADTGKAIAETEHTMAETAKTLAGIDRDDRQQAIDASAAIARALGQGTAAPQAVR